MSSRSSSPERAAVDALIEQVEVGKNKRVVALLRPPSCFGYFVPVFSP